jgi:hypothetical protein
MTKPQALEMTGGDPLLQLTTDRWAEAGVGTNAGVTVTHPASGALQPYITGIQCSGDAAALVSVESPAGTTVWRKRFSAAFTMSEAFAPGQLLGAPGAAMLLKISTSTANCEANMQGFAVLSGAITDLAAAGRGL